MLKNYSKFTLKLEKKTILFSQFSWSKTFNFGNKNSILGITGI